MAGGQKHKQTCTTEPRIKHTKPQEIRCGARRCVRGAIFCCALECLAMCVRAVVVVCFLGGACRQTPLHCKEQAAPRHCDPMSCLSVSCSSLVLWCVFSFTCGFVARRNYTFNQLEQQSSQQAILIQTDQHTHDLPCRLRCLSACERWKRRSSSQSHCATGSSNQTQPKIETHRAVELFGC